VLEAFLREADEFWERGSRGRLDSGPWSEPGPDGAPRVLEATALPLHRGRRRIVVAPVPAEGQERDGLRRRVRELRLELRSLRRDQSRHDLWLRCLVHDLNAPLASLAGALQLLRAGDLTEAHRRHLLEIGVRQCRRQSRLVRDLFEVLTADRPPTSEAERSATCDLAALAHASLEEFQPAFERGGVQVRIEVDPDAIGVPVRGEANRIERVIANLLENALRFAPTGGHVILHVRRLGAAHVECIVDNDGPGVPPALLPRLFELYTRDDRGGGAAGVGLFYCRLTVERWGGRIEYEPREGGARFRFRLPAVHASAPHVTT
jgi:signal transduction histidine kinase